MNYCDLLTKDGNQLAVIWSGGGGEGDGEILLNDNPVETESGMAQALIDLVGKHFDYGYFDGNFSSDAKVIYNPQTKRLEGIEEYSEVRSDIKDCVIEFFLPKDLWFDRMEISIDTDSSSVLSCSSQFIMTNGPLTNAHADFQNKVAEVILQEIRNEMKPVEHFQGIWKTLNISRNDFTEKGTYLSFAINSYEYFFSYKERKKVKITLGKPTKAAAA